MGKRVRTQIDINEIFYDGIHDEATKARIMKSPAWPVIVSIYSFTDKRLKVGPAHLGSDQYIHLLTKSGLPAVCVRNYEDKIAVMTTERNIVGCDVVSTNGYTTRLETNNVRYAVSKFGPSAFHDVRETMLHSVKCVENGINEIMRMSLDYIVDKVAGRSLSKPVIRVDATTATALARIAVGGEDKSTLPLNVRQEMEKAYTDYVAGVEFFNKTVNDAANMFTGDKWIVINNLLGGIVVGAVSNQPILAAYETYKRDGGLPSYESYTYLDYKIPLKWYKSMESLPPEMRSDLETSLLMLKAHTNSPGWFPNSTMHDGLKVWDSVEAFSFHSYFTGDSAIFVLNK